MADPSPDVNDLKDPIADLADAEASVPAHIRRELLDCAVKEGRISYLWLLRLYKRGVRDGRDASEGVLSMAVYRLGGLVEGRPTERVNFLQRIDELVAAEADLARLTHERDEAVKDALYHADCRPNRRQAEAYRDDAKAMNDKWADEVVKTREALAHIEELEADLARLHAQLEGRT